MKTSRWTWALVGLAFCVILVDSVRNGGWLFLLATVVLFGGAYVVIQLAVRRGYEWRPTRGVGLIMLGVMLVVFIAASTLTGSVEVSAVLAAGCAAVVLLATGLKQKA